MEIKALIAPDVLSKCDYGDVRLCKIHTREALTDIIAFTFNMLDLLPLTNILYAQLSCLLNTCELVYIETWFENKRQNLFSVLYDIFFYK